jgi:hypothetical protein
MRIASLDRGRFYKPQISPISRMMPMEKIEEKDGMAG